MNIPNTVSAKTFTRVKEAGVTVLEVTLLINVRMIHGTSSCTPTNRNMLKMVIINTSL